MNIFAIRQLTCCIIAITYSSNHTVYICLCFAIAVYIRQAGREGEGKFSGSRPAIVQKYRQRCTLQLGGLFLT